MLATLDVMIFEDNPQKGDQLLHIIVLYLSRNHVNDCQYVSCILTVEFDSPNSL